MHFPEIVRRAEYKKTRSGTYYADYKEYYDEISEDCKHRCVYCDARLEEIGGEGMHLDHFRPQKHFPALARSPDNLVLACARCNQLKSDWWPGINGDDKDGRHGFIDPFVKNKSDFFEVDSKGEILGKRPPANYVIELLYLNRVSRTSIRRRRAIVHQAHVLLDHICSEMTALQSLPAEKAMQRLAALTSALKEVKALIQNAG